jgi:hypothetical protein
LSHQALAEPPPKSQYLYVLVRSDLPPGLQIAQACHGAFEFAAAHPLVMRTWLESSNYLVVLGVPDEETLLAYADAVWKEQLDFCLVHEPDISEHTALVIAPSEFWKHMAHLPLALKEPAMIT